MSFLADLSFPNNGFGLSKLFPLLGYGLIIEVIQYHLSYRMFSLLDVTADVIGLVLYGFSLPAPRYVPLLRRRWNVEV
jgi:VanZ family protein